MRVGLTEQNQQNVEGGGGKTETASGIAKQFLKKGKGKYLIQKGKNAQKTEKSQKNKKNKQKRKVGKTSNTTKTVLRDAFPYSPFMYYY